MAIVFIAGTDDFLVQRAGKERFATMTADLDDPMGEEIVDGAAGTVAEVEEAVNRFVAAVQTLPMFSTRKAVWLKDISFLADSVTGRSEGAKEQVARLQEFLPTIDTASIGVLLTACPVDRRRREAKWFEKETDYTFLGGDKRAGDPVAALVDEEAQKLGVRYSPDARELLQAKLQGSTRLAIEETRKLATFLGDEGDTIEEAHVRELVPQFGEGDFFEASEAFFSGQLAWALEAIHRHFFAGYDARPLLTTLQGRNRLLIQLRVLLDSGELSGGRLSKQALERAASRYAAHFGEMSGKSNYNVFTQNPWYLGRLVDAAGRFPLKRLITFQTAFIGAFEAIIARPNEQEQVLRELAVHCLG